MFACERPEGGVVQAQSECDQNRVFHGSKAEGGAKGREETRHLHGRSGLRQQGRNWRSGLGWLGGRLPKIVLEVLSLDAGRLVSLIVRNEDEDLHAFVPLLLFQGIFFLCPVKVHLGHPRLVIPATVVATAFLNLLLNLVAVFIFAAIRNVHPQWAWFELPVILLLMVILTSGAAMLVSCLFVRYRDVKPITEVLLQALFYGTPIFYPVERIAPTLRHLLVMLNPFAAIIQAAKHAFVPQSMTAAEAAGGTINLLVPLGIIGGLFALGFYVFNKEAPRIAEEL